MDSQAHTDTAADLVDRLRQLPTSSAIRELAAALDRLGGEVVGGDPLQARLGCLSRLVRLEPNPGTVERFLLRASALLTELEQASRWQELAAWLVDRPAFGASPQTRSL